MKKIAGPIIALCVLVYPFAVYWGLERYSLKLIGWIFLTVILLRFIFFRKVMPAMYKSWLILAVGISLTTVLLTVFNDPVYLKLNPVIISGCMCLTFALTLKSPPSMIESFARMSRKDLPDAAIPYCRKVTVIWVIFLFLNSMAALYTCFYTDMKIWTLYNGFIAYILMGILFAGEFIYRKLCIDEEESS